MRILVSGGWGYGNIGDDAILDATVRLLGSKYPESETVWTSYDQRLTIEASVGVNSPILSAHRILVGTRAFGYMQSIGRCVPSALWPKIPRRFYERLLKRHVERIASQRDLARNTKALAVLESNFASADVVIMSGGGYFNQWPSMFAARIRELEMAHRAGCKVLLIGQSIGPFTEDQKVVLKSTLRASDCIIVRDQDSVNEVHALGFEAQLAPDLAMGFPSDVPCKKGMLTLVPAELRADQERLLIHSIADVARNNNWRVTLTLTRLIYPDLATLNRMYKLLHEQGVNAKLIIPKDYHEMRTVIEGSEWVMSRGLHALILGWRSGSKVFALTKSRKVDGFLAAIGCASNQCAESRWNLLGEEFRKLKDVQPPDRRIAIATEVERAFFI